MSRLTRITTLEKATQKSIHPSTSLGTPQELLVGVMPGIRAFDNPAFCGLQRSGLAFLGDHIDQATVSQGLSGKVGVIGTVEVDARLFRQFSNAIQSLAQKWRVVTVCRSGDDSERDAICVNSHRAFDALFSSIHRASARLLASTRGLRDAAI